MGTHDPAAVSVTATVPAHLGSLRILTGLVRRCLADSVGLLPRDEDMIHVLLALREACTNVIRHSYKDRPSGPIRLRMDLFEGGVAIEIEDEGAPVPSERVVAPRLPDADDLAEGGYGLGLIQQAMDDVRYGSSGEGVNYVRMFRSFRKAA